MVVTGMKKTSYSWEGHHIVGCRRGTISSTIAENIIRISWRVCPDPEKGDTGDTPKLGGWWFIGAPS